MLAIYTRLSKEDPESNSVDNQLREGKEYAALNNIPKSKIKIYNEGEGLKASAPIEDRPELSKLIEDVKNGKINLIWARKQNRISRKNSVLEIFLKVLVKYNIKIYFGDRGLIDLSIPSTKMMVQILGAVDEYAPNSQSIETKKTLRDNIKEGKAWGVLPYGYRTTKNMVLKIDKKEAEIVKRIFNYSLKGWGIIKISNQLNSEGIPTRFNKYADRKNINKIQAKKFKDIIWRDNQIKRILKCKWYIGERTYSGNTYPTPKIDVPYHKVQKSILKRTHQKKNDYRYLLKGLIKCGKCGRNYYGLKKLDKTKTYLKNNFYQCSSKRYTHENCGNHGINISKIESFMVKHLFASKDLLNQLKKIDETDNGLTTLQLELKSLNTKLKSENTRANNLVNLLADDLEGDELLTDKYKTTINNIKTLKSKIYNTESRIEERTNSKRIKTYNDLYENFDVQNNFTRVKEAIHNIIEKIIILTFHGKGIKNPMYLIKVKYKGFDETSTFITSQPYKKWMWTFKSYKKQDGIESKKTGYEKYLDEWNVEDILKPIYIESDDLIVYN